MGDAQWTQPTLAGMPVPSQVLVRVDVVVDRDEGTSYWTVNVRDVTNHAPLYGWVIPYVQLEDAPRITDSVLLEVRALLVKYGAMV